MKDTTNIHQKTEKDLPRQEKYLQFLVVYRGFTKISGGNLTYSMVMSDLFFRCSRDGNMPSEFVSCNARHNDIRDDIDDTLNEKTVRRALIYFEEAGYITKSTRKKGGKNQGSTITLNLKVIAQAVADAGCQIPLYGADRVDLGELFGIDDSFKMIAVEVPNAVSKSQPTIKKAPEKIPTKSASGEMTDLHNFGKRLHYISTKSGCSDADAKIFHNEAEKNHRGVVDWKVICDAAVEKAKACMYSLYADEIDKIDLLRAYYDDELWPIDYPRYKTLLAKIKECHNDACEEMRRMSYHRIKSVKQLEEYLEHHEHKRQMFLENQKKAKEKMQNDADVFCGDIFGDKNENEKKPFNGLFDILEEPSEEELVSEFY